MTLVEVGDMDREHTEWLRAEAVKIAFSLHKYAPRLEEVLRDAEIILEFITVERTATCAEIIPIGIVPRDGGDAA